MKAGNLIVTTNGRLSAPIRTDRDGGVVPVDGGSYTSSGNALLCFVTNVSETLSLNYGTINKNGYILVVGTSSGIGRINETMGIECMETVEKGNSDSSATYTLDGCRVDGKVKGVVIRKGKKIVLR